MDNQDHRLHHYVMCIKKIDDVSFDRARTAYFLMLCVYLSQEMIRRTCTGTCFSANLPCTIELESTYVEKQLSLCWWVWCWCERLTGSVGVKQAAIASASNYIKMIEIRSDHDFFFFALQVWTTTWTYEIKPRDKCPDQKTATQPHPNHDRTQ